MPCVPKSLSKVQTRPGIEVCVSDHSGSVNQNTHAVPSVHLTVAVLFIH
jgi:hypothetical protein